MYAVDSERDVVDRQTYCLIGIGSYLDRPVVAAQQHRIALDQPFGRSHTNTRTAACVELIVDAPVLAPASIDEDSVTRLQTYALLLQGLL